MTTAPTERMCFAEPESDSIIDEVHPQTGLSHYSRENLSQIRARYPKAEIMSLEAFCEAKGARQNTPIQWDEIAEDHYFEWLEVLPPAAMYGGGFLVGEPCDHSALTGQPRFQGCLNRDGKFLASSRPITKKEFAAEVIAKATGETERALTR